VRELINLIEIRTLSRSTFTLTNRRFITRPRGPRRLVRSYVRAERQSDHGRLCAWARDAHESFEDPAVAEVMNRLFRQREGDREERRISIRFISSRTRCSPSRRLAAHMFLTPTGRPFFSGVLFPRSLATPSGIPQLLEPSRGLPEQRMKSAVRTDDSRHLSKACNPARLRITRNCRRAHRRGPAQLEDHFDSRYGGFGGAPKFPHPRNSNLPAPLRAAGDRARQSGVHDTLERMALGGIYDQIGGGFSRYSVDAAVQIPHFEKMLYDNGPLLTSVFGCLDRHANPLFARSPKRPGWVMREMQSPEGGYYSSLDADPTRRGKFYVWSPGKCSAVSRTSTRARAALGLEGHRTSRMRTAPERCAPLAAVASRRESEDECAPARLGKKKALAHAREAPCARARRESAGELERSHDRGMARAAGVGRDRVACFGEARLGFIRGTM